MRALLLMSLLSLLSATLCTAAAARAHGRALSAVDAAGGADAGGSVSARFKPGEVLIKFVDGADSADALGGVGAKMARTLRPARPSRDDGELVLASVPPGMPVREAARALAQREDVLYAEPNYLYTKDLVTNDAWFNSPHLWGMKGGFGSQATLAWDQITDCSSVFVAVVDEGIQYNHSDLNPNMWYNSDEKPGNGIDDDGNGYVDDMRGYDFANKRGDVYSAVDIDDHGTHVAGTIGAAGNNNVGVAGVCHRIKLISAKFMGRNGGYLTDAVLALDYITNLKRTKGLNIIATSNSWSCGTNCFSQFLLDAINRAYAAGILFITSAGNFGSTTPAYPAAYASPAVIAVGAIQADGALSPISSRGSWVHLGAPGTSVLSTIPGPVGGPTDAYVNYTGTSQAAPHVTGAAALYKARYPYATADEVKAAILASVAPTPSLSPQNGIAITSTGGRLDINAVLNVLPALPCIDRCNTNEFCSFDSYCDPCLPTCATCTGSTSCTSCPSGWAGTTCNLQVCNGINCAANQFCSSTLRCANCPTNCTACASATNCTACVYGFTGATCALTCGKRGVSCTRGAQCCSGLCNALRKCT